MTEPRLYQEKLHLLLEKMGIEMSEIEALAPYRERFIEKKTAFADYFYDFFCDIADTRAILEDEKTPGLMKKVWAGWFESFFRAGPDDIFLAYLWKVGVRHVEVNLDQRFSNLGFAILRQFCHRAVLKEAPLEQRSKIMGAIDKMIDLCLLVETTAYIENSVSCDIEVMKEVADRVRNPAMVIGWNIRKLQSKVAQGTKEYDVYRMLMSENDRLEKMVKDIKVYMEIFQGEPQTQRIDLKERINAAIERLRDANGFGYVSIEENLNDQVRNIEGDPVWIEHLFYYLLQNAIEAVQENAPVLRVSSQIEKNPPFDLEIEIFNSGSFPEEETEKLFTPFYSTKTTGTGFGLPIARLVAKKHHGALSIKAVHPQGTCVIISLPRHSRQ